MLARVWRAERDYIGSRRVIGKGRAKDTIGQEMDLETEKEEAFPMDCRRERGLEGGDCERKGISRDGMRSKRGQVRGRRG